MQRGLGHPSMEVTLSRLSTTAYFRGHDPQILRSKIDEMLTAGSRYRNLEKALGCGIVFALGTEIPELT